MYIGYLIGVGKLEWVDCPGCGQTSLLFTPGTVPGMNAMSVHAEDCPLRPGPHHEPNVGQDDPPPVPGWDSEEDEEEDGQAGYQFEVDADDLEFSDCPAGTDF